MSAPLFQLGACAAAVLLLAGCGSSGSNAPSVPTGSTTTLALLETTDLHTNLVNHDYYQDKPTDNFGLAKTAGTTRFRLTTTTIGSLPRMALVNWQPRTRMSSLLSNTSRVSLV